MFATGQSSTPPVQTPSDVVIIRIIRIIIYIGEPMTSFPPSLGRSLQVFGLASAAALLGMSSNVLRAQDGRGIEEMVITGLRASRSSTGATGLNLDLGDTPQAIVQLNRELMDSFALDSVNTALRYVNGVNVETAETERTTYFVRGFDIQQMQIDGVRMNTTGEFVGSLDTALYEKIEVIRGANGLLTGIGAPSGTVNYIRKRPLNDTVARLEYLSDRWNTRRLEGDFSTPLTSDGRWAARVVGTHSDEDSWMDRYSNARDVAYAVVDGQLTPNMVLTLGYSYQSSESSSPLWGALPTVYDDGTQTYWDPSTSNSMDWTFWDTRTKNAFAELMYQLPGDWRLKLVASGSDYTEDSETIWYDLRPNRDTGLGMTGWPGAYPGSAKVVFGDISLAGTFSLFGREHELVVGASNNEERIKNWTRSVDADDPVWGATPAFFGNWNGTEIPRPPFGPAELASEFKRNLTRYYSAANWQLSDSLTLITGVHFFDVETTGTSWWEPADEFADETSPYMGVTWAITDNTNVYASYSDIFQPQSEQDVDRDFLGSAKGENYEIGIKQNMFDSNVLGSLALYKAELNNYAEWDGYDDATGFSWFRGSNIETQGVEIDFTGRAFRYMTLQAGYSFMDLVSADSGDQRTYLPEHTVTLLGDADIPAVPGLSIGASLRWQSEIHYTSENTNTEVKQKAYALIGLNASYDINDQFTFALNLDNITDETYLTSLYWADIYAWDQAFYGEPRNVTLRLTYEW